MLLDSSELIYLQVLLISVGLYVQTGSRYRLSWDNCWNSYERENWIDP